VSWRTGWLGGRRSRRCDAQPLRQHRPRRGLVRGMETARSQPGQPRLRIGHHRVPVAHLRPATPVDVSARNRHACAAAASRSPSPASTTCAVSPARVTSDSARRQPHSARNTVRSPGLAGSPASAAGVKPSQNRRLVCSDHGPRPSNSAECSAIASSARFTDTPHGSRQHRHQYQDRPGPGPNRRAHLPRRSWPHCRSDRRLLRAGRVPAPVTYRGWTFGPAHHRMKNICVLEAGLVVRCYGADPPARCLQSFLGGPSGQEPLAQQRPFCLVVGQVVRLQPRGPRLLVAAHLREQLATGRVVDVVAVEFCG